MNTREFLNSLAKGKKDVLQQLLAMLAETRTDYCLIGGLAVNAYVEPVVSLDIDIVVAVADIQKVAQAASDQKMKVEEFPHRVNISGPESDLRIQIQTDPRYQAFIASATTREVLGYQMRVASLDNILQGKAWAYMDDTRRTSKRHKDLADIARIIEAHPDLAGSIPEKVQDQLRGQ